MLLAQVPAGLLPDAISAFASAVPQLDQEQPTATQGGLSVHDTQTVAQTVTAGIAGRLQHVELPIACSTEMTLSVDVRRLTTGGAPMDTRLAATQVSGASVGNDGSFKRFTFTDPAEFAVGETFAIVASAFSPSGGGPSSGSCTWLDGPSTDTYPRGAAWWSGAAFSWTRRTNDMPFRTLVESGPLTADLDVTAFGGPNVVTPGQFVNFTATVKNQGTATTTWPFTDQVWISTTPSKSGVVGGVGGMQAPSALAAGASYNTSFNGTVSSTLAPGSYYFVFETDSNSQVSESDEANNTASLAVTVAAGPRIVDARVVTSTGAPDRADVGDSIALRFDRAVDNGVDASLDDNVVTVTDPDGGSYSVACTGTLVTGNGLIDASCSWNAETLTLTMVMLGDSALESQAAHGAGPAGLHWPGTIVATAGIRDLAGTAIDLTRSTDLVIDLPPQTVTVSAEAREDLNGDGDLDEGEPLMSIPRFEVYRISPTTEPILVGSAVNTTNISVIGIEPGTFEIIATGPQGHQATSTTTLAPGQPNNAVFLFARQSSLSGIARCGDVLLPGATVELMSGRVVVATTEANSDARYSFSPVAANATYTVRITGFIWLTPPLGEESFERQFFTCGVEATTGADGNGTAAPGTTIPNRLNHTWTTAFDVTEGGAVGAYTKTLTDYVFTEGQSTWFKFPVRQGQHVTVNVTNLPADYSVTLYKDIRKLYLEQQALINADPLANVDIIDGSVAPDALSPDALSPDALSPDALSPDALSPDALSPDALSPDALSPDALSPDALSPDALSPDALSPDALSPDALSPDALSGALSPDVYASAQVAALIGVSAHVGLSPERIARNTWSNSGYFYVRVRGHNGTFDPASPFTLTVTTVDSACAGAVLPTFPALNATTGLTGIRTVILTNSARLASNAAFAQKLAALSAHSRVNGVVVDLATLPGVPAAYAQWDTARLCPAAANVIAQGIRDLVGRYRALYPIEHVVLVGGDGVIPFFRTPDQSGLGNERDYAPPVLDDSASQASLKLGYVLTQDPYASGTPFSRFDHELYIPEIGVGRLVETPAQITSVIDAFLGPQNGVITPGRALVTGYDFLSDAALAIAADLIAGGVTDTDGDLIQPVGHAPTAATAWTADQLRSKLLTGPRADIVALNGHFSANRALAADYATRFGSEEIGGVTDGRFVNTLVLSTGCHSGYNIIDGHAVQGLTQPLDFPQAFALQGATLVGGTGYQYGDTDFIKYSELIHTLLVRELRYGTGPVSVGQALANAKRAYVSQLAALRGIDEKALAEATLYGLPMTAVELPVAGRLARPVAVEPATSSLGGTLSVATLTPSYTLDRNEVLLTDLNGTGTSTSLYYDINDNVAVSPGTPVLPLLTQNVQKAGTAARGVVLLGANYADEQNVLPLTNVATTEVRGAHAPYTAEVFTPVRPVSLNHFAGTTLVTTPYQFRSNASGTTGTARTITQPTYRIYYSSSIVAAEILASPPVVYAVHLTPVSGGVRVDVITGASNAVGIEEIYATYTGESGAQYGSWASLQLTAGTSTTVTGAAGSTATYSGTIATAAPDALRVFVQAVAGNGLVSWATNNGAYYRVINESATVAAPKAATALALSAPASGTYLGTVTLGATLTSGGAPLAGRTVSFRSGDARIDAQTDASGFAQVAMPLGSAPGTAGVSVGFAEDAGYLASGAESTITVGRAPTLFAPATLAPVRHGTSAVVATLRTAAGALGGQPITISANGRTVATFTDGYGRVRFDSLDGFPIGNNPVTVRYTGNDRYAAAAPLSFNVDVYAPSVNGGGWILAGGQRSNFSVNAGFKPGSTTPDGRVELHARNADGLFRATAVTRLVADAGIATVEGVGTWNAVPGYRFVVVVTDGATDRFQISITTSSGTSVYSASGDLGGGSITVR